MLPIGGGGAGAGGGDAGARDVGVVGAGAGGVVVVVSQPLVAIFKSVDTRQVPITLEWKNTSEKKRKSKAK